MAVTKKKQKKKILIQEENKKLEEGDWIATYEEKPLGLGWELRTSYIGPATWKHVGKRWWPCGWVGHGDYCQPCVMEALFPSHPRTDTIEASAMSALFDTESIPMSVF